MGRRKSIFDDKLCYAVEATRQGGRLGTIRLSDVGCHANVGNFRGFSDAARAERVGWRSIVGEMGRRVLMEDWHQLCMVKVGRESGAVCGIRDGGCSTC